MISLTPKNSTPLKIYSISFVRVCKSYFKIIAKRKSMDKASSLQLPQNLVFTHK